MTMLLGLVAAGSAQAHDATQLIYDLSALRTTRVQAPAPRAPHEVALPTNALPLSSPSGINTSGDDLELVRPSHTRLEGIGVGSPRGGNNNPGNDEGQPNPTPEPGSMLLLGGALAAGARRFLRRR
jgi:hypothetical protein